MKKSFTIKPLAMLALAGLFYGCQQQELSDPVPVERISQAAAVVAENCDVLDFEDAGRFPRDDQGYITGVISKQGANVQVRGFARYSNVPASEWLTTNRANIFNTTNVPADHPDADLGTPNWNNTTPSLGNVLIVQELVAPHNVASDPNDNSHGGKMEFDFSATGPVTVNSMNVVDIEQHYELRSRVDFYDAQGNKINTEELLIAPTGDNGVGKVTFSGMKGVLKMVITLDGSWNQNTNAGSGGIDNIEFCRETPPQGPCGPCEGKVNSLTFRYNGADNATLIATAKVGSFFRPILKVTDLDAGETFTLDGSVNTDARGGFAGTLGTEVVLVTAIQGKLTTTMIHTSCSQPIYQSYEDGLFTTLAGSSKIGGPLCEFKPPVEQDKPCSKYKCHHECDKKCAYNGRRKCEHKCDYHGHKDGGKYDRHDRDGDHGKDWDDKGGHGKDNHKWSWGRNR